MNDMFPKSALPRPGHHPERVDRCLETAHKIYDAGELDEMDSEGIRVIAFDVALHDYQPQAVDVALDRFEAALLQRRHATFVAKDDCQIRMDQVVQLATTLYPRLLRLADKRFAPTSGQDYDRTDADALTGRIAGYFDSDTTLTSNEVREAVFHHARGDKVYGEPSIDRYLTRAVEAFLSVE